MPHLENWWSEIRTHEPEGTDLQSACFVHLHIHQCDGILHKLPSFICLQPTKLGKLFLQPFTASSPQRYWVGFHL